MIGKFLTGKSFRGCLLYCLNDKQQKPGHEMVVKDRAEVILFNQCFGNQKELINQFNEVRQLNNKLAKPVLHITLSPSPGDNLTKADWQKLAADCATEFGFDKNQFVAVLHNDTSHQHLHLIANRIGFDKRTVSDSNSFKKMAAYCRKMELKYDLEQVLSPRQFLSKDLRNIPRIDERKAVIKSHIREALLASKNYSEFELHMKHKNYEIIKGRGIAFIDPKKVYIKGSEVGFSLSVIEKLLGKSLAEKQRLFESQKSQEKSQRLSYLPKMKERSQNQIHEVKQDFSKAIEILLRAEEMRQQTPHELLQKKRKRKHQSHHL